MSGERMTAAEREEARIAAVVQDYLDGMTFADESKLMTALHPRWSCIGMFRGRLEWDSREAFIEFVKENAAPPADGQYYHRILATDVTGDTATVKVEDDYLGLRFTDYLTLMRLDGDWVIVNKAFHLHGETSGTG